MCLIKVTIWCARPNDRTVRHIFDFEPVAYCLLLGNVSLVSDVAHGSLVIDRTVKFKSAQSTLV